MFLETSLNISSLFYEKSKENCKKSKRMKIVKGIFG